MTSIPVQQFASERLREFTSRVFQHFGVAEADANEAAGILAASDLRGIDSHGVARLHAYTEMLAAGRVNPKPQIRIVRETLSTATVDGDNGLGLVVGPWANRVAIEKAANAGTGWVAVNNSNHYGIASWYVMEALRRDMIGWSMTNATRTVAPLWGAERMLGTNPISIAFPGKEEPPIVIDMATCAVAFGKIEIANRKGVPIPEGWALDSNGVVTTDPKAMVNGGALMPLGSDRERGGHKGYSLSLMVDVLCGVLSGANWGPFTPPFALRQAMPVRSVGKGIGHFFGAMRIDAFIDPDEFKGQIDDYIRTMRATKPAAGTNGPLLPGDPEREAEKIRSREGVPLIQPVIDDLRAVSKRTGVPFE